MFLDVPGSVALRRFAIVVAMMACASVISMAIAQPSDRARNPNDEILSELEDLDTKIDDLEAKIDALAAEQVTASFCISQARAGSLEAAYKLIVEAEIEGGLGWAEVFSGEATAEVKAPAGVIPSETALKLGAAHGRGFDVCVDLPVQLGPDDAALLAELAEDINTDANDFPDRGKFQRRAHRLLNYAKRRVPGVQRRTTSSQTTMVSATAEPSEGSDDELDKADQAIENLMAGGVEGDDNLLDVFKGQDVQALADAFDEFPVDVASMMGDPERAFHPLSDASRNGIDELDCASLRIGAALRDGNPGLERLCSRMEGLPDFDRVEQVLSGELIADLYDALDTLTIGSSPAKVSSNARSRFCQTKIGKLFKYNDFCNR